MKNLLILFLFVVALFATSVACALDDCDSLFKQALNAEEVIYKKIDKEWPEFHLNEEGLKMVDQLMKTAKDYNEKCFDHYAYPDVKFIEKPDVLRLALGYAVNGKKLTVGRGVFANGNINIKMSSFLLPEVYTILIKGKHPEAVVAYLKIDSIKHKNGKMNIDAFRKDPEIEKQVNFCVIRSDTVDEYVVSCGENIEKPFKVSIPNIVVNIDSIGEELVNGQTLQYIKTSYGQKVYIQSIAYILGLHRISFDIISWLEKEMIPRGYLKPSTSTEK